MARANRFYVGIEGAKELDKLLEGMGDDAAGAIDNAVRAGGEIALQKAKQYAGSRIKHEWGPGTGALERNITMRPVMRRAGHAGTKRRIVRGSVSIGFNRTKKGAADDAYYGTFVELGTKYQPAKKMMRDAVDWNRKKIAEAVKSAFLKLIRG